MESTSCEFRLKLESHENTIRELCVKKQVLEHQLARQEDSLKEVQNKLDEFLNKYKSTENVMKTSFFIKESCLNRIIIVYLNLIGEQFN